MKKPLFLAIICCVLPIAIISLLLSRGNQKGPTSSNHQIEKEGIDSTEKINTDSNSVGTAIGNIAPDFQLIDVERTQQFTKSSLKGKPLILWYTASYCVPCQVGAEEVKRLDDDLGGNSFHVVMVFIDPREELEDLLGWKVNFGNDDWYLTRGHDQLIQDYNIKYLDTQYLLDSEGVIRNVAYSTVGYEGYKSKIQSLMQSR